MTGAAITIGLSQVRWLGALLPAPLAVGVCASSEGPRLAAFSTTSPPTTL